MKIKEARRYIGEYYANVPRTIKKVPYEDIERKAEHQKIDSIHAAYELGRNAGINEVLLDIEKRLDSYSKAERKKRVKAAINVLKQDAKIDIDGMFKA
jgi:hypothetical protein